MLGSRSFPSMIRQIVFHHVRRMSLLKNLGRTLGLERAARVHDDSRSAILDALGQYFGVMSLVFARQQRAEILDAFAVR